MLETDHSVERVMTHLQTSDTQCLPTPLLFLIAAYVPTHALCECKIAGCETQIAGIRPKDSQTDVWYTDIHTIPYDFVQILWDRVSTAYQHHHCPCCKPRVPKIQSKICKKCCSAVRCSTCIATCVGCKSDLCPECSIHCEICNNFICNNHGVSQPRKKNKACRHMFCEGCSKNLCTKCRVKCSCKKVTCGKCSVTCTTCFASQKCVQCTYVCGRCGSDKNNRFCEECTVVDTIQGRLCRPCCYFFLFFSYFSSTTFLRRETWLPGDVSDTARKKEQNKKTMILECIGCVFLLSGASFLLWLVSQAWQIPVSFLLFASLDPEFTRDTLFVCEKGVITLHQKACHTESYGFHAQLKDTLNRSWLLCGSMYCVCCEDTWCVSQRNSRFEIYDCPPVLVLPPSNETRAFYCQMETNRCFVEEPWMELPPTHILILYATIGILTWCCCCISTIVHDRKIRLS